MSLSLPGYIHTNHFQLTNEMSITCFSQLTSPQCNCNLAMCRKELNWSAVGIFVKVNLKIYDPYSHSSQSLWREFQIMVSCPIFPPVSTEHPHLLCLLINYLCGLRLHEFLMVYGSLRYWVTMMLTDPDLANRNIFFGMAATSMWQILSRCF